MRIKRPAPHSTQQKGIRKFPIFRFGCGRSSSYNLVIRYFFLMASPQRLMFFFLSLSLAPRIYIFFFLVRPFIRPQRNFICAGVCCHGAMDLHRTWVKHLTLTHWHWIYIWVCDRRKHGTAKLTMQSRVCVRGAWAELKWCKNTHWDRHVRVRSAGGNF